MIESDSPGRSVWGVRTMPRVPSVRVCGGLQGNVCILCEIVIMAIVSYTVYIFIIDVYYTHLQQ